MSKLIWGLVLVCSTALTLASPLGAQPIQGDDGGEAGRKWYWDTRGFVVCHDNGGNCIT